MRKIIHIDMDAFYASVEIRDNPDLKNKPVIISGPPNSRSVVCTCNYIARRFGIHSAMPSAHAYKLCPQGIFILPQMEKYKIASEQIHNIFKKYTEKIEPLSLDEAYLDVSNSSVSPSATMIAEAIKKEIWNQTSLRASAGVSFNKFLAKIASDWEKPDGLTVVTPEKSQDFLSQLPIDKFYGVGKKTAAVMKENKIFYGKDLLEWPLYKLQDTFGKSGTYYYNVARGIDERDVSTGSLRKSIGREITLAKDIQEIKQCMPLFRDLYRSISSKCSAKAILPRQLNLKIKYANFESKTRVIRQYQPMMEETEILDLIEHELVQWKDPGRSLRLLGLSFGKLIFNNKKIDNGDQLSLLL